MVDANSYLTYIYSEQFFLIVFLLFYLSFFRSQFFNFFIQIFFNRLTIECEIFVNFVPLFMRIPLEIHSLVVSVH